jgi:glycine dehydrogenase subunit 1
MRYLPTSETDRRQMLAEIGLESIDQLFESIPEGLRLRRLLDLPRPLSEPELVAYFQQAAHRNTADYVSFLGAGAYRHHIPVIIDALISRSEFYTSYTPYQAEIAQGTLQAIFEFQTYITQLTGMDVANASLYDGSTGVAEAVLMAHRVTRRTRLLIARTVHPEYREVVSTYARNLGLEIVPVDFASAGRVDVAHLRSLLDDSFAGVVIQSPNFFGSIENTDAIGELVSASGALFIVNVCEAMSMALLKPPARADIVVGEGQSFGIPLNFGGPHLGFLATRERFLRQMPGRLVGMGKDFADRRAFVLTLSTREQHIRREKATSNICTNQSLCALMATIYLAALGPRGLREAAEQNLQKTHYAVQQIQSRTPHRVLFPAPRFNEFVLQLAGGDCRKRLRDARIVPGLDLARFYPELGDAVLVCVTETTARAHIDALVEALS